MEDLLAVCVLEDAAGFATEETWEATALGALLLPITVDSYCRYCIGRRADEQKSFNSNMRPLFFTLNFNFRISEFYFYVNICALGGATPSRQAKPTYLP